MYVIAESLSNFYGRNELLNLPSKLTSSSAIFSYAPI